VQKFTLVAQKSPTSVHVPTVQYLGGEFARYVDSDSAAPFMTGLRGALEAPLHDTQVLNTAVALSNVVALLAITLGQSEEEAEKLVTGAMARSASAAFPELVPLSDVALASSAQAMICRVFGTVTTDELPDALDGRTLAAIAAYGDAGIMLADEVGLPREVLAGALEQAAVSM